VTLVRLTPLTFSPPLGCFLKLECLQRTGSFKLRGAALRLSALSSQERGRGVVVASAGNHGLGIAEAARALGIAATVIVSRGSAETKREGIRRRGAHVVISSGDYADAEREARAWAAERKSIFVSPFDDEYVIRGNGDGLGEELLAQFPGVRRVVVPIGGGGLAGGLGRQLAPRGVQVIGVQPRANCAMYESIQRGHALTVYDGQPTRAEGLEGPVAQQTYALCRTHLDSIVLVDEAEILAAIGWSWKMLGLALEPSAAVTVAAARAGKVMAEDDTVLVVSGGNLDESLLDEAIQSLA